MIISVSCIQPFFMWMKRERNAGGQLKPNNYLNCVTKEDKVVCTL